MKPLLTSLLITSVAFADVITDWNAIMRTTISGENPLNQARLAAITHLAMFEAVNAITKDYKPYLGTVTAPAGASVNAAAATAAHVVLRNYFPLNAPSLDAELVNSLANIPEGAAKTGGVTVGRAAAVAMITKRANDGSSPAMPYTPLTGIGYWQPTPPTLAAGAFLHWAKLMPFGIARPDQFRSPPPPPLTSAEYRRDYNEVKAVGGATGAERSQALTTIVRFAAMTGPVPLFNSVAVQLSAAQDASITENARMFALLNMSISDAAIAVWDSKYHYNLWRPVTAIRAGDRDPNPKTVGDPGYSTLIVTPPYPSYPSGYGGLAAAARYILERFFGSTHHTITLSLPAFPGVVLQYTKVRQITDDIADARVYGGIHFRFDQDEAEVQGRNVAQYVKHNNLRCAREDQCEDADEDNVTQ